MSQQYYPIVFQLGARFVRVGFAGDAVPTAVRRTNWYDLSGGVLGPMDSCHVSGAIGASDLAASQHEQGQFLWPLDFSTVDVDILESVLERLVHDLYTNDLLVDPKKCKVLIVEPAMYPLPLKNVLTRVFLFHMHAQSVRFLPESVMTAVSSGSHCALVIDMGWNQTTVMPVFDFRQLYPHYKQTRRAGRWVHLATLQRMKELGLDPSFEFVERFIVETMYCGIDNDASGEYTFDGVTLPQELRYSALQEVLFPDSQGGNDDDDDARSIAALIHEVIQQINIDLRSALSTKIVITGGVSQIPGVKTRVIHEVNNLVKVSGIRSLGPWQGTSLYCSVSLMSPTSMAKSKSGELQRDKYLAGEEVFQDWVNDLYNATS